MRSASWRDSVTRYQWLVLFVAWLGWLAVNARTSAPAAAAYFAERGLAIKAERDQLEKVLS